MNDLVLLLLTVLGAALIVAGCCLIWLPVGFISAGVLTLAAVFRIGKG